jgi:hypothetical protein
LIGFPASTHSARASSSNRACRSSDPTDAQDIVQFQGDPIRSTVVATARKSFQEADHETCRLSLEQGSRISRRCQLASAAIGACASTAAAMALRRQCGPPSVTASCETNTGTSDAALSIPPSPTGTVSVCTDGDLQPKRPSRQGSQSTERRVLTMRKQVIRYSVRTCRCRRP